MDRYVYNNNKYKSLRKKLRNSVGFPEVILWNELKGCKLGYKFRRQYGVGKYSIDFYCPALRIGIELDGESHNNSEQHAYDVHRTQVMNAYDITILRFQNSDVLYNLDGVVQTMRKYLK